MKKYITMFKNRIAVGLEYRSNIIGTLILDIISLSSVLILWSAVYAEKAQINGYSFQNSLLYFICIPVVSSITYVFISDEIGHEIRQGSLSNYLLKPYNINIDAFIRAICSKINYFIITFPLYALAIFLIINKMNITTITPFTILLATGAAVCGFLVHFSFDLAIAWLSFWIGDVWAFTHLKRVIFLIFGGMAFPLDFLPASYKYIFEILPFKYMYYIPNSYLLGKRTIDHLLIDLLGIGIWIGIFIITGKLLWNKGIIKYEAFGG